MAGGWAKIPNEAWAEVAVLFEAKGEPWSEAMQIGDLRWWAGQVRIGGARRVPGYRKLAKRWSVSDWDARELMKAEHKWKTASEDVSAQSPRTVRAEPAQSGTVKTKEPKNPRAVAAQSTRSDRDTRGGEELRIEEPREQLVSPKVADASKEPVGWAEVMVDWNAYAKARGDRGKSRIKPKGTLKTEGGSLVWLLKELGKHQLSELLRWLATDQTPNSRAMYYRREGLGAVNIRPNHADLLRLMERSKNGQRANTAPANASDTPGHMFMRAYRNARGQHPAWLDHVPSDEREHFLRAARHCKGLVMLKTMGTHPLDNKRALETFNQSFEATR